MPPETPATPMPAAISTQSVAKIGRLAYFIAFVPLFVILSFITVTTSALGFIALIALFVNSPGAGLLVLVLCLATVVYFTYAAFRLAILRLRDLRASAAWSMLLLVPFASVVFVLALCVLPGDASSPSLKTSAALKRYAMRYMIITSILFVASVMVFIGSLVNSPFLPSLIPWNANDERPRASEVIQVIGPTPESERENYARQAMYHNELSAEFTPSGEAVGYVIYAGPHATSSPGYYVENSEVHGPVYFYSKHPNESSESYRANMESAGWKVAMRRDVRLEQTDTRAGHEISVQRTGKDFSCLDTSTKSQNAVIYDGTQVGLETIRDGACSPPVEGVLLSDDGLHYAYEVRDKEGFFVIVDGKRTSNYPYINNLHFEGGTAVFNALSSDFLKFLRVSIPADSGVSTRATPLANTETNQPGASAPRESSMASNSAIRIVSPNGGEVFTRGVASTITWEVTNVPEGTYLDLELFKITDAKTRVGAEGECLNCTGGGQGSGISAISPIENGRMSIPWIPGARYAGGYVDPGSRYIMKATLSKTGNLSECPRQFPNCSIIVASDWSDAAFTLQQ